MASSCRCRVRSIVDLVRGVVADRELVWEVLGRLGPDAHDVVVRQFLVATADR